MNKEKALKIIESEYENVKKENGEMKLYHIGAINGIAAVLLFSGEIEHEEYLKITDKENYNDENRATD